MTDQEKIELLNKLIELKRGRDQFFEKFDALFGVGHGFPGASDGSFDVFNRLFDEYSALVAEKIGDSKEGIDWFVYDNECGEKGKYCFVENEEFAITGSADYVRYLTIFNEIN